MNKVADELCQYLYDRFKDLPSDARLLVGIAGVPASGKSTLAHIIVDRVNEAAVGGTDPSALPSTEPITGAILPQPIAICIGLDGWHLSRAQLDALPDSKLAHDRRGAHWTFDSQGYVAFIGALRRPLRPSTPTSSSSWQDPIYAPSFSHEKKDPVYDSIPVYPHHRIVIIEGLYTFLGIPPWSTASEMLDERWWIQISEEEAEKRLVVRHVKTGVAKDMDEAIWRSRENDAPNGRFIQENMMQPTKSIESIEDPGAASLGQH